MAHVRTAIDDLDRQIVTLLGWSTLLAPPATVRRELTAPRISRPAYAVH